MRLLKDVRKQLHEALRAAFPTRDELSAMLLLECDRGLDDITTKSGMKNIVLDVIQDAESDGWVEELLAGARAAKSGNPELAELAAAFGPSATLPRAELQRVVSGTGGFAKVEVFRAALGRIERRVCRVEVSGAEGPSTGTGFLVGGDLVLTNHHVIAPLVGRADAGRVIVRFDYRHGPDGVRVDPGKEVRLATDWLVDSSPASAADEVAGGGGAVPAPDELDHALLRLARPVGANLVGEDEPRGWLELRRDPPVPPADAALFIVQHPRGEPLQLALDTRAVIGMNVNGTRLRYRTNTLPGSSGSPCFDAAWNLVALHHAGDPDHTFGHRAEYNQGIPVGALFALLSARGLAGTLGGAV